MVSLQGSQCCSPACELTTCRSKSSTRLPRHSTALRLGPPPTVLHSNVAIFGAGPTQTARSCTEKRPSSRPLLLPNRPLSAVYMPYLLSYCAGAAVVPRSCRCWPSLALACAALVSCAMGRGEWLCCCCICCICCWCSPQAKINSGLCRQHKHTCCCCCCCLSAAFDAAAVAALPTSCCPHVPTTVCFFGKE